MSRSKWSRPVALAGIVGLGVFAGLLFSGSPPPGKSDYLILTIDPPWETYTWENGVPSVSPSGTPVLKKGQSYTYTGLLGNCASNVTVKLYIGGTLKDTGQGQASTSYTHNSTTSALSIVVHAEDPDGEGGYEPPDDLIASIKVARVSGLTSNADASSAPELDYIKAWVSGAQTTWTATLTPSINATDIPNGFIDWGTDNGNSTLADGSDNSKKLHSLSSAGWYTITAQ